jgi:hypothetical protein
MDTIYCGVCNKGLTDTEEVFGDMGNFYCKRCYGPPKLTRNQLNSNNVKNFYINRKRWNDKANEQLKSILSKCDHTNYKP